MRTPLILLTFGCLAAIAGAQAAGAGSQPQVVPTTPPPGVANTTATNAAAAMAPAVNASSLLQPALAQTQSALSTLKIDKWKKGSVRDEAGENVTALMHDLQTNIPPLIAAADAEPASLSRALPLMKHLDAFYDVLLRVEEGSRVSAPGEQITALQQTLLDVNKARNAYDDQMQSSAAAHEKQIFDLQTRLRTVQQESASHETKASSAAAAAPCKPAPPAHKKKKAATPRAAGTTTNSAKPAAGTPVTKPQ
ncbi:MAG TPA: hypothetical protein VGL22_13920 [Terracidiphilus sp.]|jgi:hypothetical protein